MKTTHIYIRYMALLWVALFTLAGCNSEITTVPRGEQADGMMPVSIQVHTADYSVQTRANGSVKGVEGIGEGSMQLLCFDKGGYFLGMGQSVTIEANPTGDENNHSLRAVVYNSTARIHFLANANITMDPQWVGMGENILMNKLESKYDVNTRMVYWGYLKQADPEAMKAYLTNSANVIYMLRDRARVDANWDGNTSGITDVKVALAGGADRGCMALMDRSTLTFPEIRTKTDWEKSLTFICQPLTYERLGLDESAFASQAFAYETENSVIEPLAVILKATYTGGATKYHKVYLQDAQYQNYQVRRNHTYRINVKRLNAEYGYNTAQEAVEGQGSNDIWVEVDDIISEISAGDFTLRIASGKVGATSIVYNHGADASQTIPFTYSGDATMTQGDFEYRFTSNKGLAEQTSLGMSYAGNGNESHLSFTLKPVTGTLNSAIIFLRDKKHGLSRYINLYSISHFSFGYNASGITIGKAAGQENTFTFTIPDDYPQDLYPVVVKFASDDVNPRGVDVEVGSTNEPPINQEWNCWFVKKCYAPGSYNVTMRNVRAKASGSKGKFYMKADYFGKDAGTVNQAIEIPVTFQ